MFQLFRLLPAAAQWAEKPESVQQLDICWPLGLLASEQPAEYCYRRRKAWVLDHQIPPTLPDPTMPFVTNPLVYWVNPNTGLRVDGRCGVAAATRKTVALWPLSVEPWVASAQRIHRLLPPVDPACPDAAVQRQAMLRIVGIDPDSSLRAAAPGKLPLVNLRAQGATGRTSWYIDGQLRYTAAAATVVSHRFRWPGQHQIVAIDAAGNLDELTVDVLGNGVAQVGEN
jgi:penicillin-binding protein 1C